MSSHHCSFLIKCPFEKVFERLNVLYGTIYREQPDKPSELRTGVILGETIMSKQLGKQGELRTGVILGEAIIRVSSNYFGSSDRYTSDAAITIVLEELSPIDTQIEIISYAGGKGLASYDSGRHSKYVHYVIDFLKEQGVKLESLKEESRYEGK